jgi:hypothetical protein
MFRLFRTSPILANTFPAKKIYRYALQPRIHHKLPEPNASDAEARYALQLIEQARIVGGDQDFKTLHEILDKLAELPKYRAAALVEKGKLNLLEFDLSEAKTNFNSAIISNSRDKDAKRYYLYTAFAINGVPKFLNNIKITPLSSFSTVEDPCPEEESFHPRPK